MANTNSKFAVVAALLCNMLVAAIKFVAFAVTGSGAMLSEAIHSVADSLNQFLLLVGVVLSNREADEDYAYGYGAEKSVWALMSAVGIFFLGCGVTVYHGVSSLLSHHELEGDLTWAIGVLVLSFIFEGIVLIIAVRGIRHAAGGQRFFRYLSSEADPSLAAVLLEDSVACIGVLIALAAILLTHVTGHAYWDAIGSIMVGLLLGGIAIWLIIRNRTLLVGPSIPPKIRKQIIRIIEANPTVEEVTDMRTRILDAQTYRVMAELRFDGAAFAEKMGDALATKYEAIETYEDFRAFAVEYADELIELLGDEIDSIERRIREQVPKAKYLDLETE